MVSLLARIPLRPLALLFLAGLATVPAIGCSGTHSFSYTWNHFRVDAEIAAEEREKLANSVEEVLIHERLYPKDPNHQLAEYGADAELMTSWNEEDAAMTGPSYSGYRSRAGVRLLEGVEHLRRYSQDRMERRRFDADYMVATGDQNTIVLSLGIDTQRQVNANMNYLPGEITKAEWRDHGRDDRLLAILQRNIRETYRAVSASTQREEGEMSRQSERIYEDRDREDTGSTDEPYRMGPGAGGPTRHEYDFGTDTN